jgi:hypothetical protein
VNEKQVFVPKKDSADVADVVWLLAEKNAGLVVGFLEDAHLMFAKGITLKARRYEFHHECGPASRTSYYVKPFHDMRSSSGFIINSAQPHK